MKGCRLKWTPLAESNKWQQSMNLVSTSSFSAAENLKLRNFNAGLLTGSFLLSEKPASTKSNNHANNLLQVLYLLLMKSLMNSTTKSKLFFLKQRHTTRLWQHLTAFLIVISVTKFVIHSELKKMKSEIILLNSV